MSKENEELVTAKVLGLILGIFIATPLQGYVFQIGWNMFLMPFTQIQLSFWVALGILAVVRYTAKGYTIGNDKSSVILQCVSSIIFSLITLGEFYLINYFKG